MTERKLAKKKLDLFSRILIAKLRHSAPTDGITVYDGGWVKVEDILAIFTELTQDDITQIVEGEPKQRLALNESKDMVRANQGHSFPVDLQLEKSEPPAFLLHGTKPHFVASIMEQGILKQTRHAVHLTSEESVAAQVGGRKISEAPIILTVNSGAMHQDGFVFMKTANDVWLTDNVPPRYIISINFEQARHY